MSGISKTKYRSFQRRVYEWFEVTFSQEVCNDKSIRQHRFFEEATELVQSLGMTQYECHQLVDYVYSRPIGEPKQEIGGVRVTLAALCYPYGFDLKSCGDNELARCWKNIEKIRAKQAAKPMFSPYPKVHLSTRDVLWLFFNFIQRNVTQWKMGAGDHHHPIWELVACELRGARDITSGAQYVFLEGTNRSRIEELPDGSLEDNG
jgi:hypothetical protein